MKSMGNIRKEKTLNHILPKNHTVYNTTFYNKKKIIIVIHLHYTNDIERYMKYIDEIPIKMDIYFTISNSEQETDIINQMKHKHNFKIIRKENRGRDVSAFLVACREHILCYDYVCFIHDKKEKAPKYKADTDKWIECLWENTLGSKEYINNIIGLFETCELLGLLVPPAPLTENFNTGIENGWYANFNNVKKLITDMGLNCDLDINKSPLTLGTVFWAKVEALKKLLEIDWKYEDFDEEPLQEDGTISHAIERILAYVARDAGYDTGRVMNDMFAVERLVYMEKYLGKASKLLQEKMGVFRYSELECWENRGEELREFAKDKRYIHIYGAGKYGKMCFNRLKYENIKVTSFLISKREQTMETLENIPIVLLDEIELNQDSGIIVAVRQEKQKDIIKRLCELNFNLDNIYMYDK